MGTALVEVERLQKDLLRGWVLLGRPHGRSRLVPETPADRSTRVLGGIGGLMELLGGKGLGRNPVVMEPGGNDFGWEPLGVELASRAYLPIEKPRVT